MLTFNQIYSEVQEQTGDDDDTSLVVIKRAINQGMAKFGAILNRNWRVKTRTFSTKKDQQYYQLPEDAIKIKSITVTVGSVTYPLEEVVDEQLWNALNLRTESSDIPEFFFPRGSDEFGIWPIPTANGSSDGTLRFESQLKPMSAADYSTGTVDLTNGSDGVVGTGTTFTASMIGRYLIAEGGDGQAYKITAFTDATNITIENNYGGVDVSGASYTIGELPDIPYEFHESLVDYGCYRMYRRRRDRGAADDMKKAFDEAIEMCRENYSSSTSSQYIQPKRKVPFGYIHRRRDYEVS